jgi:hypothetical protein
MLAGVLGFVRAVAPIVGVQLLAAYLQMRAILTRLDGTSMTFTAKGL